MKMKQMCELGDVGCRSDVWARTPHHGEVGRSKCVSQGIGDGVMWGLAEVSTLL